MEVQSWGLLRDEVELRATALFLSEIAAAAYDVPKKFSCAEVLRAGRVVMKELCIRTQEHGLAS
eukprot:1234738-Amphidinium_carterae.2